MNSCPHRLNAPCHDAKRTMSVSFGYYCAARFFNALRFSFFDFFFSPDLIRRNRTK